MTPFPELTLHIKGHPVVLKNSKDICFNKKTGRRFVKSNPRVEAYMEKAMAQVRGQTLHISARPIIRYKVNAKILSYGAWKDDAENIPDSSNLYQAVEDVMEAAGVLANDNLIESHDGSRRIRLCPRCDRRPIIKAGPNKGGRKRDCGAVKLCPFERVAITITPFVDDNDGEESELHTSNQLEELNTSNQSVETKPPQLGLKL